MIILQQCHENDGANVAENQYKPIELREQIRQDLQENLDKFKDPVVLGELVYRLMEERENTNRLLKTLMQKIDSLEAKIGSNVQSVANETKESPKENEVLLPQVDEDIMKVVKELGKATAEDIRSRLHYKGKNAASARLNRLFELGLLKKVQVGKKVFFLPT